MNGDPLLIEGRACDLYNARQLVRLSTELKGKESERCLKGAGSYAKKMETGAWYPALNPEDEKAARAMANEWAATPAPEVEPAPTIVEPVKKSKAPRVKKENGFDRIASMNAYHADVKAREAKKEEGEPTEGVKDAQRNPFLEAVALALESGALVERTSAAYWVYLTKENTEAREALKQARFWFSPKRQGWYKSAPAPEVKRHEIKSLEEVK